MTPNQRGPAMARLLPLEIYNVYGLLNESAWERYFFNETVYTYTSQEQLYGIEPYSQYDLTTEEGRRQFEVAVHKFMKNYPGSIVPEGESFNFKEFYARWHIVKGKDLKKFDPELIQRLKNDLIADNATSYALEGEEAVGKTTAGKTFPKGLRPTVRKAIMPKGN